MITEKKNHMMHFFKLSGKCHLLESVISQNVLFK